MAVKLRDYERGRNDGLLMAEKIVKRGGLEELHQEMKFRGMTGIHTAIAKKELDVATHKIKEMTLDTMLILAVATLRDEFDFGQKRCQRFINRMNTKAEGLIEDMATWKDYQETIKEEMGIEMEIRYND